jgi:hypothetical protein
MRSLLLVAFAAAGALGVTGLASRPAVAQQTDRIIDIYGDEKCPSNNGQDIVVCRRHSADEKYRIPKTLREQAPSPQAAGNNGVAAMQSTGGTGVQINSCNSIGAGVAVGCVKQEADAWKAGKDAEKKDEEGIP